MASRRRRRRPRPGGRVIPLRVRVPASIAREVSSRIYTYRSPQQVRPRSRVYRRAFRAPRGRFVPVVARVRVPRYLPKVSGSFVSVDRGRLNVHSRRQHRRLMRREYNRVRYSERKSRRSMARLGQLDSRFRDRHGIMGFAVHRESDVGRLADAALFVRSLGNVQYR